MSSRADIEDYLHGAMSAEDAGGFEDALFASADTSVAREVQSVLWLSDAIRVLRDHEASVSMTCVRADLDAFRARGGRMEAWTLEDGGRVRQPIAPDTQLVVGRLPLPLADVRRVDLEIADPDGPGRFPRVNDVEVDRAEDCVWVPCAARVALASQVTVFRLFAHHTDGRVTTHQYTAELG
jgi:hypothetical protein